MPQVGNISGPFQRHTQGSGHFLPQRDEIVPPRIRADRNQTDDEHGYRNGNSLPIGVFKLPKIQKMAFRALSPIIATSSRMIAERNAPS